ncbi:MAG: glycoside hydrolase family 3 C-terminal domain-containing protein [bacterium]|nr:glycoside hydrolase family 3 C-terminal domain-containing protein [bacterium]MDY3081136.1 glycoside hydrolase family 3 C-terminal domain-containing protein [Candidatus Enterosoma sp.]MDY5256899.1 glycoside hydrolase family 3 C-terminal domain-containing protein [Candidatus Enterosoma sp.]
MNRTKRNRIITLATIGIAGLAIMGAAQVASSMQAKNLDLLFPGKTTITDNGEGLTADYVDFKAKSQDEALKNAQDATQKTAEEGITLLKNEDSALPLQKSTKVTILGYYSWHNNMSGGEDPATTQGAISIGKGLEARFDTNQAVNALYAEVRGDFADPAASLSSASASFAEYSTAVVTIKRNSGEGNDQSLNSGASEQNRTGLTINNAEMRLLDFACKNFEKVILVVNSANAMELGFLQESDPNMNNGIYTDPYNPTAHYDFSKIKAALWAGCCGSQGGTALANILDGTVNPSGHLVDTYVRDLTKDPTYKNFGSYKYTNSKSLNSYQDETFFVEYEEGIYVGYRYYETACYEADKGNYAGFSYDNSVVFPFGYGLSYTNFELAYEGTPTYDKDAAAYTFNVKITNTGSVKGKGVAQIYVNAPYTKGGVEKSHVVLGGFAKSKELAPNESDVVTIVINDDYFSSYDYKNEKCYIMDAGDYNFYLSDNAHSWKEIDSEDNAEKAKHLFTKTIDKKLVYKEGKDGKRKTDLTEAVNKEDDELNFKFKAYNEGSTGDGYIHDFSRADFKASFPTSPTGDDFVLKGDKALEQVAKYNVWDEKNNPIEKMPEVNTDETSYTLAEMRGVDYDDPKWDDYINQFTLDSMVNMFSNGGWNELGDEENGVPTSYDADSPYGYYAHALTIKNINKWYCGDPMVAASFNVEIADMLGEAFGEEAYCNKLAGGSLITGLYGYGLNTHRSAFGGRNYEYYSEDGLLAGKMAAHEASKASEKGLIAFMKHYVLNDQETNRQKNGYCAWVNEQAFREIYTKGWEIYIKEAKMNVNYYGVNAEGKYEMMTKEMPAATGIMTAYNRIGARYAGASDSLNLILRDEFGYHGTTITDAGGQPNTYMTTDLMIRKGGHLTLTNNGSNGLYDTESPTAVYYLKDATKHILYNKANSNCMIGIAPGAAVKRSMAPWRVIRLVAWILVGGLALADAVVIALIWLDKIKVAEKVKAIKETESSEEF